MDVINPEPPDWARVDEAQRLRAHLLSLPPYGGTRPDGDTTRHLFAKWLKRENLFVCQNLTSPCDVSCEGNRCSCRYWMEHCGLVARLMSAFAAARGLDDGLYHATGLLHDLDYPAAPHYPPGPAGDEGHPVPLVQDLVDLSVPPVLSLAVLEHSPHLGLQPSSRLSAVLIGCDEAATIHAFGMHPPGYPDMPESVRTELAGEPEREPFRTGPVRPDVFRRMRLAFALASSPDAEFTIPDDVRRRRAH